MLLGLLKANGAVSEKDGRIGLTAGFADALRYRDLMETKLEFARLVLSDFADLFGALMTDPGRFVRCSRTFELFSYGRALEYTPENYEATRRWVRFTTALTRCEAASCIARYDFGRHRSMLDVGGNSGEFGLQVCKRHAGLKVSVFDLPLVCDIGRQHVAQEPEAGRISFIEGNAFADPLPPSFDLISFKSMLHDWPDKDAYFLLEKAAAALEPGGSLLIFERGRLPSGQTLPYASIPILLFFRYFREPVFYEESLSALGLQDVRVTEIMLDSPFYLITGTKKK